MFHSSFNGIERDTISFISWGNFVMVIDRLARIGFGRHLMISNYVRRLQFSYKRPVNFPHSAKNSRSVLIIIYPCSNLFEELTVGIGNLSMFELIRRTHGRNR